MVENSSAMQNRLYIPVISLLVILVLTGLSAYLLLGEQKKFIAKKTVLSELKRDLGNLDKILIVVKTSKEKLNLIKATMPGTYDEIASAMARIETLAVLNNSSLESLIEPEAMVETNGLSSLTLTLKTSGNFNDLTNFMTMLSKLPYHSNVDNLQINNTSGKIDATIKLGLYINKK